MPNNAGWWRRLFTYDNVECTQLPYHLGMGDRSWDIIILAILTVLQDDNNLAKIESNRKELPTRQNGMRETIMKAQQTRNNKHRSLDPYIDTFVYQLCVLDDCRHQSVDSVMRLLSANCRQCRYNGLADIQIRPWITPRVSVRIVGRVFAW